MKKATDVGTAKFAKTADLASLKLDFHKLDINKLKTASVYLSKLSHVVKNYVVRKIMYDKLVTLKKNT